MAASALRVVASDDLFRMALCEIVDHRVKTQKEPAGTAEREGLEALVATYTGFAEKAKSDPFQPVAPDPRAQSLPEGLKALLEEKRIRETCAAWNTYVANAVDMFCNIGVQSDTARKIVLSVVTLPEEAEFIK